MAIELKEIEITDPEYTKEPAWVIKKTSVVPGDETPFYLVKQILPGGMVELEYLGAIFGKGNPLLITKKELDTDFFKARIIST
ncbi:MAG: hypothetical protein UX80_C0001G0018 [Candidatus Amesbacteria bacterium GW2011_GWA2_47_11b]|uniref:Uncharacterized protein n=3 Tax=Candidatus Amesiibacteriota TaxID=1752730 RepID=A0A0G1UVU9_9BACT|nr:MAG: hypothetical protein UX42_C0013G0011 [Microgenomates group bacterium GW2011_GWC1_46_20]KKU58579.1 MAG: hypothetical protein UX80_C0001G0018 [Candidatus Amesbacteria bacterium GW2011_GWA2_47_11b]KKU70148.1 MAG: hypothetical protein UX92_C0004G0025 [Candidatus Amesbacteria bacterium GW2011_GWA1_47_20]KKU84671.1 MAG: hypothetical protein UY11_C0005G0045 [Candidatus Amesbacteria bacterium GW2011_GWC2_47_8]